MMVSCRKDITSNSITMGSCQDFKFTFEFHISGAVSGIVDPDQDQGGRSDRDGDPSEGNEGNIPVETTFVNRDIDAAYQDGFAHGIPTCVSDGDIDADHAHSVVPDVSGDDELGRCSPASGCTTVVVAEDSSEALGMFQVMSVTQESEAHEYDLPLRDGIECSHSPASGYATVADDIVDVTEVNEVHEGAMPEDDVEDGDNVQHVIRHSQPFPRFTRVQARVREVPRRWTCRPDRRECQRCFRAQARHIRRRQYHLITRYLLNLRDWARVISFKV